MSFVMLLFLSSGKRSLPDKHREYWQVLRSQQHGRQYQFPMLHELHLDFPFLLRYFLDIHQTVWRLDIWKCRQNYLLYISLRSVQTEIVLTMLKTVSHSSSNVEEFTRHRNCINLFKTDGSGYSRNKVVLMERKRGKKNCWLEIHYPMLDGSIM